MESTLVIRQTFWELEEEMPERAGRRARSYTDFDIRYDSGHTDLPDDSAKLDDASCKATAETCSSAGSSADVSESWADMDTDTEFDESETYCTPPKAPEQQQVQQHVMMPVRFVMVPVAQTNMVPQASALPGNEVRSRVAPPPGNFAAPPGNFSAPPGNFSLSLVQLKKSPARTTVVLRNLPSQLSRSEFVTILEEAGFSEQYDFLYLPTNFRNMTAFGYAIVNFTDPADAQAALEHFQGSNVDGQDVIAEWSKSQQGYDDLVCRYRNSPVMHSSVPDKHKPILLSKGHLQSFPPPTEPLQPPRKFAPTEVSGF